MATWSNINPFDTSETTNDDNSNTLCQDWPFVSTHKYSPFLLSEAEEQEIGNGILEGIRLSVPNFEDNEESVFIGGCSDTQPTKEVEWATGLMKFATLELLREDEDDKILYSPTDLADDTDDSNTSTSYYTAEELELNISEDAGVTYEFSNLSVTDTCCPNLQAPPNAEAAERSENKDFATFSTFQKKPSRRPRCNKPKPSSAFSSTSDSSLSINSGSNICPVFGNAPNIIPNSAKDGPLNIQRRPATSLFTLKRCRRRCNNHKPKTSQLNNYLQ